MAFASLLLRMPHVCYTTKSNYKQTNYEETSYEPGDTGRGAPSIRYQPRSKRFYSLQPLGVDMFAVTGITGQVGGGVARTLLDARKSVRAVIRDSAKGESWAQQGCEVALARMEDPDALQRAFSRAEAVFVLLPPNFDPSPGFIETRHTSSPLSTAR
jgi:NmrA-like family